MEFARRLHVKQTVERPASDIDVRWEAGALEIKMYFSRVVGGPDTDLLISFGTPLAFQWEDEMFGYISGTLELPKCEAADFRSSTYPLLEISGSRWAASYAGRFPDQEVEFPVTHYYFVAFNDLVHVLSMAPPTTEWIPGVEA